MQTIYSIQSKTPGGGDLHYEAADREDAILTLRSMRQYETVGDWNQSAKIYRSTDDGQTWRLDRASTNLA